MLRPSRRDPVRALFSSLGLFSRAVQGLPWTARSIARRLLAGAMFPVKKERPQGLLFLVVIFFFFFIECLFDEMERLFLGLIPSDFFLKVIRT